MLFVKGVKLFLSVLILNKSVSTLSCILITSTHVNVATIGKIASDIAKNYAEVNHLNADTTTINSLRPYIVQKMGLDNVGTQLSNLSTEYDLGLNLKYGDKVKGQQLKSQEYENSTAGRARSWLSALSSILGVALGGAALIKGQKGSSKKVGTRKTTDVYSNDQLVKSIVEKTNDEYRDWETDRKSVV